MATRMVLVPEDQQALAYQQRINISPQVRSLSNLDALMQYVLYNSKLPRRKRMRLYDQLRIRKQNILRQYGDAGLRPAVELAQPRRRSLNRQDLVTQAPSGGIAGEPDLEPPPIPLRRRAGPRPQRPQAPIPIVPPVPAPRRRAPVPTPPPRRPVPTPRTDADDRLEALTQSVRSRYSPASAIAQRTRARTARTQSQRGRTVSSSMPPRQLSREWTRLRPKKY